MASKVEGDQITVGMNGAAPVPCSLRIETQQIDVSTATASKPDMDWVFVDAAGHFHAFDHDGKLPTVIRREETIHVDPPDDDDFDEYTEWDYSITHIECGLCSEEIKPRYVPDDPHRTIPGLTSYTLTLHSEIPADRFSVVVRVGERMLFGFGQGRMVRGERGPTGAFVPTYEVWCGPMSWRKLSVARGSVSSSTLT